MGDSAPSKDPATGAPAPVLILAPPRSCSTVTTAMLGCHPDLYALPEMKLFRRATVGVMLDDWPTGRNVPVGRRRAGLLRGLAQVHSGDQTAASIDLAMAWLTARRDWTGAQVLGHVATELAPLVVVEKSPENCAREDYLSRLLRDAPHTRLLHLVRHPVETAESLHGVWTSPKAWALHDGPRREFDIGVWFNNHQRIVDALSRLPPERWRRVRAEDLLNAPDVHLPPLLDWIGVRADPGVVAGMARTEDWPFASPGPENATGGGDEHFHASPALRPVALPVSVEVPRSWQIDPWTTASVLDLAGRFGYV